MNNDYQDRKRNSFRDNHVKQFGNKRPYHSELPPVRNDQRRESSTTKRRRMNPMKIEDEYHEYVDNRVFRLIFLFGLISVRVRKTTTKVK